MSLIMACNYSTGIVMTADKMITGNTTNKDGNIDSFTQSESATKLFIVNNKYGLAYCGESTFDDDELLEVYIKKNICFHTFLSNNPSNIAEEIGKSIQSHQERALNTTLLFCGYHNDCPFMYRIDTNCSVVQMKVTSPIVCYGETDIADKLLSSEYLYYFKRKRAKDAISLLQDINATTSKFQKHQYRLQSVSEECDVLLISSDSEVMWITPDD